MVVVVVAVVVVVMFVFSAAVYITPRLNASKPVSMCSKKIRLFATVYSRACVCVCARGQRTYFPPFVWPLESIRCIFQFMNMSNCVRFSVRGNTLAVEYGFVTSVADPNYVCVFILIKIKVVFIKQALFYFRKLSIFIKVAKCNHRNTSARAVLENMIVVLSITR